MAAKQKKWVSVRRAAGVLAVVALMSIVATPSWAVPSFARQTGMTCAACHTAFPELTPFGREFKLNGYTIDNMRQIKGETMERRETLALNAIAPLSVMLQVSYTHTGSPLPDSAISTAEAKDGDVLFPDQFSLFYAGKIANDLGAFVQATYDGAADHFGMDNTDIRWARYLSVAEPDASGKSKGWFANHDLLVGVTLNNNPTVQDVWNSTPAWGFPFVASSTAPVPNAAAWVNGPLAQNVAGLGAYLWLDHHLYAEFSLYTAAILGGAHPLDSTQSNVLNGVNPYWRVGYEFRWDRNSWFIGTYGLQSHIYPGNGHALAGPPDRYTDTALDTQYQYIGDDQFFTVLATYIHEDQRLNASYPLGLSTNIDDHLNQARISLEYGYHRTLVGTASFFSTDGSSDSGLYPNDGSVGGSVAASPQARGYTLELDYLPFLNTKLTAQYTGYTRFNGGASNYSGTRSASDNNTLYLQLWISF